MSEETHRIVVSDDDFIMVNMIYREIDDEILGAFSGDGGGGLFHQDADGEFVVSDDFAEFQSQCMDLAALEKCAGELEKLRAEFENINEDGDLVGLSDAGLAFVDTFGEASNGCMMAFSEGASEDFIYDIQDEWNLNFYLD